MPYYVIRNTEDNTYLARRTNDFSDTRRLWIEPGTVRMDAEIVGYDGNNTDQWHDLLRTVHTLQSVGAEVQAEDGKDVFALEEQWILENGL